MTRRKGDGVMEREYIPLKLERERVVFFPATWTVVHPIDRESPLWGMPHVILTPHVAARTYTALENMSWVVRDIYNVLDGKPPKYPAP